MSDDLKRSVSHEIRSGVVADWLDHRDATFTPLSSAPLPAVLELDRYRRLADETWHQRGEECTGFALAAIANYLIRRDRDDADLPSVSRRMLYEMAQRYDGEMHVEGSTLRGALKGWSRVGVASDSVWPYDPSDEHGAVHGTLNLARLLDSRTRPLMGYQRIAGDDIEVMRRALAEGHPVYAAARTHVGWYRLFLHDASPTIRRSAGDTDRGVHAFVIIGYDEHGFLIHNSWGPEWGEEGYAVLPYDQWAWGATDTWVVDAGIESTTVPATEEPTVQSATEVYRDMWPHLVVLDDHGQLVSAGPYEMDHGSVKTMLYLFDEFTRAAGWTDRKLAIIADDGADATARTIERFRPLRDKLLGAQIYPIFLVWQTSWRDHLHHELITWANHRRDDKLDAHLAPRVAAAESRGAAIWDAIRGRSIQSCTSSTGGARLLAQSVRYKRGQRDFGLLGVSIGAGDILLAPLATLLPAPVNGVLSLGPATTMHDFSVTYHEMLARGSLERLTVVPTADELTQLIGDVWSLPGSKMRQAGRECRRLRQWPGDTVPLFGLVDHLAGSAAIDHFQQAGRIDIGAVEISEVTASQLDDFVLANLTATPATTSPAAAGLPRDPLRRAELLSRVALGAAKPA